MLTNKLNISIDDKAIKSIIIGSLYIIGLFHWYLFINYNEPSFNHLDWPLFHQLYDVIKQSIASCRIPYHATLFASDTFESTTYATSRFLAVPWIAIPPQVFLMRFISVAEFITLQYLLFYSISFIGVYKWTKKLHLPLSSSCFLLILFNFNGAIISKAGAGHFTMTLGYMLIPWFFLIIYKFIENKDTNSFRNIIFVLKLSFFLFFCLLNTDMHIYFQMILVGLCVFVFYPKRVLLYISGVITSVVFSFWYFLPVLLFGGYGSVTKIDITNIPESSARYSGGHGYGFIYADSGTSLLPYDTNSNVLINISYFCVNVLSHLWESMTFSFNAFHDGVWEYNLYISYIGVILLIGSLMGLYFRCQPTSIIYNLITYKYRFLVGMSIVALFSIGPFYRMFIQTLQLMIIFTPVEWVPSRFAIYPFSMVLLIASLGYDDLFKVFPERIRNWAKWTILLILLAVLLIHSYEWSLSKLETYTEWRGDLKGFKTVIYDDVDDGYYKKIVKIAYISSVLIVSCFGMLYMRLRYYSSDNNIFSKSSKLLKL